MPIVCRPPDACQCPACAPPGTFSDGPPEREGHIGARFDNVFHDQPWRFCRALLDGEDLSAQTTEACPGFRGYVVVATYDASGHLHKCRTCWRGVCSRVVIGRVEVVPPT